MAEFVECRGDSQTRRCLGCEFVVTATDVLHERVPADDHLGGSVGSEGTVALRLATCSESSEGLRYAAPRATKGADVACVSVNSDRTDSQP